MDEFFIEKVGNEKLPRDLKTPCPNEIVDLDNIINECNELRARLNLALQILNEIHKEIGIDDFGDLTAYFEHDLLMRLNEFVKYKK